MNNRCFNTGREKVIRRSLLFISTLFFAILISCSQKYDETGIFDPQDPDFHVATLLSVVKKDTIVNSLNMIQDDYIYLGADIATGDTSAYGEILFNFELFNTDSTLDSAYILMPVFNDSIFDLNSFRTFEVLKVNDPWDITDLERDQLNLTPYSTNNFYSETDTTDSYIKIDLDLDFIATWFTADSLNESFNGFLIRSTPRNEISSIIKLYSSRWAYDTYTPKVHRFTTDTLLAYDGLSDSTSTVETTNNLSTDLSFVKKESACIDTAISQSKFKIGGISGEGIVCKIELDTIPSNATVITGRFEITHDSSDPVYGSIRNIDIDKELCIYKVTNSNWMTDIDNLEYDTLNVWEYKINPLDSTTTLMVADGMMQEWITDPSSNHGFYITSKNWGQPFGYMIFDNLQIKVSYITLTPGE